MKKSILSVIVLLFLSTALWAQEAPEKVWNSGSWKPGTRILTSANGQYELVFQNDGNLALRFFRDDTVYIYWSTHTGRNAKEFRFKEDGNLAIYGRPGEVLWTSDTHGKNSEALMLEDNGNLVLHAPGAKVVWETGTVRAPNKIWASEDPVFTPDSLVMQSANSWYKLIFQGDGNLVLLHMYSNGVEEIWNSGTANKGAEHFGFFYGNIIITGDGGGNIWNTDTTGSGAEALYLQDDGNLVLHAPGAVVVWSSGTAGR
jgi:hypothetical protein